MAYKQEASSGFRYERKIQVLQASRSIHKYCLLQSELLLAKARRYPSKYMSIIIDGMDQAKTAVPQMSVHQWWRTILTPVSFQVSKF